MKIEFAENTLFISTETVPERLFFEHILKAKDNLKVFNRLHKREGMFEDTTSGYTLEIQEFKPREKRYEE